MGYGQFAKIFQLEEGLYCVYKKIMVRIHILAQKLSHDIMVITSDFGSENISLILVETTNIIYNGTKNF